MVRGIFVCLIVTDDRLACLDIGSGGADLYHIGIKCDVFLLETMSECRFGRQT